MAERSKNKVAHPLCMIKITKVHSHPYSGGVGALDRGSNQEDRVITNRQPEIVSQLFYRFIPSRMDPTIPPTTPPSTVRLDSRGK